MRAGKGGGEREREMDQMGKKLTGTCNRGGGNRLILKGKRDSRPNVKGLERRREGDERWGNASEGESREEHGWERGMRGNREKEEP